MASSINRNPIKVITSAAMVSCFASLIVVSLSAPVQAAMIPFTTTDDELSSVVESLGIEEKTNNIPLILTDQLSHRMDAKIFGARLVNKVENGDEANVKNIKAASASDSIGFALQTTYGGDQHSSRVAMPSAVWLLASALVGLVVVSRIRSDRSAAAD